MHQRGLIGTKTVSGTGPWASLPDPGLELCFSHILDSVS